MNTGMAARQSPGDKIIRIFIILGLLAGLLVSSGAQAPLPARAEVLAPPPSIFGVDMPAIRSNYGLSQMLSAGAYWVRGPRVDWAAVEPSKGVRNWAALTTLDVELQRAKDEGMQTILIVSGTPSWAQKEPPFSCGPILANELPAFASFMFDLVNHYKDRVKYYELWNEPDVDPELLGTNYDSLFGCWGDDDDTYYGGGFYADMLEAVYPQVKAADPSAQVLVGGLLLDCDPSRVCPTSLPSKFFEGILRNQGAAYFDGVSYHAYDYYGGQLGQYGNQKWLSGWDAGGPVGLAKAEVLQNLLADPTFGAQGKYLVNTEASLVCSTGCTATPEFEQTKAYYLAQSYAGSQYMGLQGNLWFSAKAGWRNSDLLEGDLTPLPAYDAFQFAQSKLLNAAPLGEIRRYPGVMGYEFSAAGKRLWVVWSIDGSSHTIFLPGIPAAAFDVDGDPLSSGIQMQVGLEPIYIELPHSFALYLPSVARNYYSLLNGAFEAGLGSAGNPLSWQVLNGGMQVSLVSKNPTYPVTDGAIPSGAYTALLGSPSYACANGLPLNGYAGLEQTFPVPYFPNGVPLQLTFQYVIYTQDGGGSDQYDRFEVFIKEGATNRLVHADSRVETSLDCNKWYRIPQTGWATVNVDLISPVDYRGKLITISFQNWNRYDRNYNTFTYLDNVAVQAGN